MSDFQSGKRCPVFETFRNEPPRVHEEEEEISEDIGEDEFRNQDSLDAAVMYSTINVISLQTIRKTFLFNGIGVQSYACW
jgi:hypothetical protein